ncbi:MAG: hypothetical protein IJQ39_04670 [Thermoguttaceae bacterium]|nr:hypothetical protein [Thermoguttaceae bacterium]
MLKYTGLIQQIECLMDDPTAAPMERIAELASEYSQACEWVNEKTLLCVDTLRQGNASEALRLSRELDLLENYKTLVFDDYDAWISAALTFGDVAIPAFNRRLIDELDAAHVCMGPIEEVLKSHRILALSHSPLSLRVPILRKLVELDPRNAGWKRELQEYETARMEEIYEELSHTLPYADCVRLLKEVEGSRWSIEIPLKIKKRIAAIRQEYQKKSRQKQIDQLNANLTEIADNLVLAYNNYDFEGAKRFRSSWFRTLDEFQTSQIIPPYDLIHSVDDVLSWIDSEQEGRNLLQEFNAKVAAADRELRRPMSIEKCQRLILDISRSADAIGQPVPERFQRHLDKLIANEERKASQRSRFATSIFVVILLAVIGGVSFGVYEFIQWYRYNSLLENLAKYQQTVSRDRELLSEAYQFVLNLENSGYQLADNPEVQKNMAFIKKLYEDDKERHEEWKFLFDNVDQKIKKGEPVSLEDIGELKRLSVLKEEKAAYAELEKSNSSLLNERADEYVKKQNEKFQEIQKAADELIKSGGAASVVKLREIEMQVMQIKKDFSDYAFGIPTLEGESKAFDLKCADLLAALKKTIDKTNSDSSLSADLDKLAFQMDSESDYVKALQSIIDKNSASSYAPDFQSVIQDRAVWGKAYSWNTFMAQNSSIFRGTNRSAIQLRDFISQWNGMTFKPSELSTVKKIDGRLPYYQSIADCNLSTSLKPLKDLCYVYARMEMWYYENPEGKRYYFNQKPEVDKGRQRVNYMDSVSVVSENRVVIEMSSSIVSLNNRMFSQKISRLLGMINDNSKFSECGVQILDAIYQDRTLRDPVIRYKFMITALECFAKSDKIIQESFGALIPKLENSELRNCNPFAPEESFIYRKDAERMLERLKDFDNRIKAAQTRTEQLAMSFPVDVLKPAGWLDKSGSQWTVRGVSSNVVGELYVVSETGLVSVGSVKNKVVKIKSVLDGKRGTPVFVVKALQP